MLLIFVTSLCEKKTSLKIEIKGIDGFEVVAIPKGFDSYSKVESSLLKALLIKRGSK